MKVRRRGFNIGLLIFVLLFIYVCIFVVRYLTSDKVTIYEIEAGDLSNDENYTGFILRNETVLNAPSSGYISYYTPDCTRVSVGSLVYTIDETGRVVELLAEHENGTGSLSSDSLNRIRSQLSEYSSSYSATNFGSVYSTAQRVNQAIGTGLSEATLNSIIQSSGEANLNFTRYNSSSTGVVSFRTDGYEGITAEELTADDVSGEAGHEQTVIAAGSLVENSAAIGKVIGSEEWDIIIPISEETSVALEGTRIVPITFRDTGISVNTEYSTVVGADGTIFAKLHVYKYMIRYADRRYVDIELNIPGSSGLKIPVSSVVTRDLYTIPTSFLIESVITNEDGSTSTRDVFRIQTYDDAGNMSTCDIEPNIFREQDGNYLVSREDFETGDVITNADGSETYTVAATAPLQGVYCVNKGYSVFRQIEILDGNDEYYIVAENTPYGVNVYDHIILNASIADDDQVLYN